MRWTYIMRVERNRDTKEKNKFDENERQNRYTKNESCRNVAREQDNNNNNNNQTNGIAIHSHHFSL